MIVCCVDFKGLHFEISVASDDDAMRLCSMVDTITDDAHCYIIDIQR